MKIVNIDKNNRTQKMMEQLLKVWESSVKSTHLFLSDKEIEKIKQYVPQALKSVETLIIAINNYDIPIAFMGIENTKLEMLFVDRMEQKQGIGTKLIQYGIKNFSINDLRVNEQNPIAKRFYENNGFYVYDRRDTDEQGNPYPILLMKRQLDKILF